MATATRVSRAVPSSERSQLITNVAVGDRINVLDVLGRRAQGVKFFMTDATDTLGFKLNNRLEILKHNETGADTADVVWSQSDSFPTYTSTGLLIHQVEEEISVSSIEVTTLTLSVGTTISIIVW